MTLTISPEIEEKIAQMARAHGVLPAQFAADVLLRATAPQPISTSNPSPDELAAGLRELALTATPIKNYPADFFSRDVLYADHD